MTTTHTSKESKSESRSKAEVKKKRKPAAVGAGVATQAAPPSAHPVDTSGELTGARRAAGGITAPPTVGAPKPRAGFTVHPGTLRHLPRIPHVLAPLGAGVAADLRASTAYLEDFGKNAPSQTDLADRLESTLGWAVEIEAAEAWLAYVKEEAGRAWQGSRSRLYRLAPVFAYASASDTSIAERYPSLVAFFEVGKAAGRRSATTRKAKAGKAEKGDKGATSTGGGTPSLAAPLVTPGGSEAAAAAPTPTGAQGAGAATQAASKTAA